MAEITNTPEASHSLPTQFSCLKVSKLYIYIYIYIPSDTITASTWVNHHWDEVQG